MSFGDGNAAGSLETTPKVVGYGAKISLPSPPNYVTRSPGVNASNESVSLTGCEMNVCQPNLKRSFEWREFCFWGFKSDSSIGSVLHRYSRRRCSIPVQALTFA